MSHYKHLTIEEREKLYLLKGQGKKVREIARELGRAPSTISREWKRNRPNRIAYSPSKAQRRYEKRRKNCGRKHILCCPEKREVIRRFIQDEHWSPEQIEQRLKMEGNEFQISLSSIYRAIHAGLFGPERRIKREQRFSYHLRRKGKWPNKKGEENKQGQYCKQYKISERPAEANERKRTGHFEADTIIGKRGKACLVSLVDRKSRFTLAAKAPNISAPAIRDTMIALLSQLPEGKVKSITPDRGPEFALYQEVSSAIFNIPFYFSDPYSPWQRGTNENTNGLIREFLPKGTDMTPIPHQLIFDFINKINLRPRKCLQWKSPFEVFYDCLLHLT